MGIADVMTLIGVIGIFVIGLAYVGFAVWMEWNCIDSDLDDSDEEWEKDFTDEESLDKLGKGV